MLTSTPDRRQRAHGGRDNLKRAGLSERTARQHRTSVIRKYPLVTILRRVVRACVNPWIVSLSSRRHYDLANTLVVAGTPRSGTTWLAEVLTSLPGTGLVFEPLHIANVPLARAAGFGWATYMEPDTVWPEGEAFIRKVLEGRIVCSWTMSHMSMTRAFRPKRWIVKFVNANLLLGWITSRFTVPRPAMIIRHPCATVASQLVHGWMLKHPPSWPGLFASHPRLAEMVRSLSDPIEFLAAAWCIQSRVPLALPSPRPLQVVSYERLVRHGESELERLFRGWGLAVPQAALWRLAQHSQTTKTYSALRRGGDPLLGWRRLLTREQIARILDLVNLFGLDFYSEEPEPDYDRLYGPSPVGAI